MTILSHPILVWRTLRDGSRTWVYLRLNNGLKGLHRGICIGSKTLRQAMRKKHDAPFTANNTENDHCCQNGSKHSSWNFNGVSTHPPNISCVGRRKSKDNPLLLRALFCTWWIRKRMRPHLVTRKHQFWGMQPKAEWGESNLSRDMPIISQKERGERETALFQFRCIKPPSILTIYYTFRYPPIPAFAEQSYCYNVYFAFMRCKAF